MADKRPLFGWKAVFSSYSWSDFFQDAKIPFALSISLCVCIWLSKGDVYALLDSLLDVGLIVTPVMVTLIVAAYTIILSFLMGDKFSDIKNNEDGKHFMKSLNSSFAVALYFTLLTVIVMIISKCIYDMGITFVYAEALNGIAYFTISFLLFFSVCVLYGIVIDIFNCGQTTLF